MVGRIQVIELRGVGPLGGGGSQHGFARKVGIHAGSKGMLSGPQRVVHLTPSNLNRVWLVYKVDGESIPKESREKLTSK